MEQRRHIFRFADFEADLDRFQLLSGLQSIKLERLPLDLLFLLLSENGHLVSREEIIARLWGDVFVDTERAVNTAVRKIRKALGDNADHPQFIETVVGKGYRFIAPLVHESTIQNPESTTQADRWAVESESDGESAEIRLRSFSVETRGRMSVLTCDVIVGNMVLGRLPLLEVELSDDVILSRKPHDSFPPKLLGARLTLTTKGAQALYASSISALQGGLRSQSQKQNPGEEKKTA